MTRKSLISLCAVLAVLAAVVLVVSAAETQPAKTPMGGMEMGQPPAPGAPPAMSHEEMMTRQHEGMRKAGMSEGMVMCHKMMYSEEVAKDDPSALLALKDDLKLTADQVTKLKAIAAKARQDSDAVLTADQKKKLEEVPSSPNTVMGLHDEMRSKMGDRGMMMGGRGGESGGMGGPGGRGGEGGGTGRMRMRGGSSGGNEEPKPPEGGM